MSIVTVVELFPYYKEKDFPKWKNKNKKLNLTNI